MPRNYGKKGNKEEDDFVVEPKPKQKQRDTDFDQLVFKTFIEQLLKDYPYWNKKGRKLTCSLCKISVQFSSVSTFKYLIFTHMKSKCHKKKVDSCNAEKDSIEKAEIDDKTEEHKQERNNDGVNKNMLPDIVREVQYRKSSALGVTDREHRKFNSNNSLTDFETTYCSLEKDNPATQSSKKFIVKAKDGRNYFCTICQELIFDSLNVNEFRYNLWTHINDEKHKEKMPNYSKIERDFQKVMNKLSRKIPENLREDLKYFEIGPIFRFVKCLPCNVAVSENMHRLENHMLGDFHQKNKENELTSYSQHSCHNHTCKWFKRLISDMQNQFKQEEFKRDIKYIHIGKMPGYVICSLCSCVILPTFYYMKVHFVSDVHIKNKTANLIEWESAFESDVKKTLQVNPKDYSMFEKSNYGIKCHKCHVTMPATSYMLYSHLSKSGCASTL